VASELIAIFYIPGIENPNWSAYKLGSTEYSRMRQGGRI